MMIETEYRTYENVFLRAERNMDESEATNNNPIGQIMKRLFDTEIEDVEESLQPSMQELYRIVNDASFSLSNEINTHMDAIVGSMMRFGYPS